MQRREYEMSEEELEGILAASKPVPYMIMAGRPPASPQAIANRAWQRLGGKKGFVWDSVHPVVEKGERFFTAEPSQ